VPGSPWSALAREAGASAMEFARWTARKRQSAGAYRRALRRHRRVVRNLQIVHLGGMGGGAAGAGISLLGTGDVVAALVALLAGGGLSVAARLRLARLAAPDPAGYPVVTVAFDSPGGRALRRLDHASRRMRHACLAVAALDQPTGRELEQATKLAEQSLRLTAQHLGTVEGLDGATDAAAKLTARLEAGVAAYEQTLAVAAELLAAPPIDPPIATLLRDVQDALAARTYGQTVAAEQFDRPA
jgi:hypothetical protein